MSALPLKRSQRNFLRKLAQNGEEPCVRHYPPARALVALGFATWRSGPSRYGTNYVVITEAGRAHLASIDGAAR